jgi:hypothetical protein
MLTSIALAFAVSVALSALWLRAVTRVTGARSIPLNDLLLITGLCSGLALLPGPGSLLAAVFLGLLVTRAERLDLWPDGVVMIAGSTAVWVIVAQTMWMLAG